ncbi:MAG: hypothetical protein IKJ65_01480 [Clostridia bacterium]|nr:hypothetical protein [Clostridia bacterium]
MYNENVRQAKNVSKSLESLVFVRIPRHPSAKQMLRYKRQGRLSRLCAFVLTVVMLVGIGVQIGKFVDIAVANKNINALKADNKLLEVSIENLKIEFQMKIQDNVVCHLAARDLGMIQVDEAAVMVLPIGNTHAGETQLVSSGYQQ